jgi:hypothetical protein
MEANRPQCAAGPILQVVDTGGSDPLEDHRDPLAHPDAHCA